MVSALKRPQGQARRWTVVWTMRRDMDRGTIQLGRQEVEVSDDFETCSFATFVPLRTVSTANAREHWRKRAARNKTERRIVAEYMRDLPRELAITDPKLRLVVKLTRYGTRPLDDDNLAGSFKAIRDEVAKQLNRDDGPKSRIRWCYDQQRGKYAIKIEVCFDEES